MYKYTHTNTFIQMIMGCQHFVQRRKKNHQQQKWEHAHMSVKYV